MSLDDTLAAPGPPSDALAPGAMIGRYQLERILGSGGMGIVWAAHDPDLDRSIALKLLKFAGASEALRKRLLREARAMARLKHPNVLTVYEVGTDRDRDFIAMELVDGCSLQEWLATSPSDEQVWTALLAAGRGLAAAHAAGVVHRDFKPHNVLRSNDGRVLVTDFGLARGLGDDPAAHDDAGGTSARPTRDGDSILDSPITQTGTLMGTPAYMAPEQFTGSEPDPRTDQFAFCVTAWQMLTGSRPYHADSIAELKFAASSGQRALASSLPRRVRAILERGLDPDPQQRWPKLDDLLDALAATRKPRTRPIVIAARVIAVAGASALAVVIARREAKPAAEPSACRPAAQEVAELDVRGRLVANHPGLSADQVARIAGTFDDFTRRWTGEYERTCAAPRARHFDDHVGCLLGVRDQALVLARFAVRAGKPEEPLLAAWTQRFTLPDIEPCRNDPPIVPPRLPEQQPQRDNVLDVLAAALALPVAANDEAAIKSVEGKALATGWKPLPGIVRVAVGTDQLARGKVDAARQAFSRALDVTQAERDAHHTALAQLGLLEASLVSLDAPLSTTRKKGELHEELDRLLRTARSAVRAAGQEARLEAQLDIAESTAQLHVAQHNRYKNRYREALARLVEARDIYERIGDVPRMVAVYVAEAAVFLERGDDHALDDAEHVVRTATEALQRVQLPEDRELVRMRARIAFARGDYAEAHVAGSGGPPSGAPIHGTLVDEQGAAAADGAVWVWTGELAGDPVNVVTDETRAASITATGAFAATAPDGAAIVGGGRKLRTLPVLARDGETLRLAPSTSIDGVVKGGNLTEVAAFARYTAGANTYVIRAAVKRDGTFRLDNLPRGGQPTFGLVGPAGTGTRRITGAPTALAWPVGQTLDVIVRSKDRGDGTAWILRGKHAAKTRAELDAVIAREANVATSALVPIGANNTDVASDSYRTGDRHAVITNNPDGDVTACAAIGAQVRCEPVVVKTTGLPYSDGRFGADVTPVVVEID